MSVGRRRLKLLGILMMVNIFIYVIVEVSKSGSQEKNAKGRVIIPRSKFWRKYTPHKAYWNKQQQKLELLYNPILTLLSNMTVEENLISNASVLSSCDPDPWVTSEILDYLKSLSKDKAKDLFIGDVIKDAGPHREKKLKYYIPESVYEGSYPPYAGGGGFLYSGDLALRLNNASDQVLLYPIDDVYTGMCLQKLGLAPEKHKGFKTFDIEEKYRNNICSYTNLMLVHSRKPQEMIKIWTRLQDPHLNC